MKRKEIAAILLLFYIIGFVSALLYVDYSRSNKRDIQVQIVEDAMANFRDLGPFLKHDPKISTFIGLYQKYGVFSRIYLDSYLDQICGHPPKEIEYINITQDFIDKATLFCEDFNNGNETRIQ